MQETHEINVHRETILWVNRQFKGKSTLSTVRKLALAAAVYFIWKERNARSHSRPTIKLVQVFHEILDSVRMGLASLEQMEKDLHDCLEFGYG